MDDIERAACQCFSRRPSKSMPGKVQKADRNAPIHANDAVERWVSGESILGRAREDRHLDRRRVRASAERNEGTHELVCVFANAAAFPERCAVVDEDAHLFKSFRVSILL